MYMYIFVRYTLRIEKMPVIHVHCISVPVHVAIFHFLMHFLLELREKKEENDVHVQCTRIQWNLSNPDTLGTEESVLISEVS